MDERPPWWVGHVVLASHDLARSVDFYRAMGLRQLRELGPDDGLIELEMRGGTHLVLVLDPRAETDGRGAPFDLMVDDLQAAHATMTRRGVEVSSLIRSEHDHDHFTFRDPDGHVVTVNDSHVEGSV
jgi:catechol 2,3-dioxygenase-like lactoylglutathione lyase family enzyme